jgi:hypothetical protein
MIVVNKKEENFMENKNQKYFFTYGSWENYPFHAGWTEIVARGFEQAIAIFRAAHPDKSEGTVNCAFIYDEETFKRTNMMEYGNLGRKCVETLLLNKQIQKED